MTRPDVLRGIRVVELCNSLTGAQIGQFLADFGAEVVQIEPPGGTPLRSHPSFPLWGRGKLSVELDLACPEGLASARRIIRGADVVVESFRPGVSDRLGLGFEGLSVDNPGLVHASVSGWGRQSPHADVPGYEALVMAKMGGLHAYGPMADRPGPAFVSVPYGSVSATQAALQGIISALYEREFSGHGQHVETSLALAIGALDPWNQVVHVIRERYSEAFTAAGPFDENKSSNTDFSLRLLVALTADGRWLQFALVQPKLFRAFMRTIDLEGMVEDPEWASVFTFQDRTRIGEANIILLEAVRKRTLAQWQEVFDNDPDVFAELFRVGSDLLHHPQIEHDQQAIHIDDPTHGRTLQPAAAVRFLDGPSPALGPAPLLDADRSAVLAWAERPTLPAGDAPWGALPLEGVTVLEIATFYAGPYGSALLTDLGARVIKIEPLDGDPLRLIQPFPETGAAKVLQGKESVAVDLGMPAGREIVLDLARRADLVLCSFRAGVAERLGLDAAALHTVNPDLMYLNCPGYGVDGPYGRRAAFAATISAGTGVAMRNMGEFPDRQGMSMEQIRLASVALTTAGNSGSTQPDGIGALVVGTALCLAAFAQRRGDRGRELMTTMLLSTAHALSEEMVEFEGRTSPRRVDQHHLGLGARYRLYETAQGWVFLAVPGKRDWTKLVTAMALLAPDVLLEGLAEDEETLAMRLEDLFATRGAREWESRLLAADVGCVVVEETSMPAALLGELGRRSGYVTDVVSPFFDEYPRVGPLVSFSRSATQSLAGCGLGQHTDAVLEELGIEQAQIDELRADGVIG
ncbi:CaiB/BaiF CoA transferase family protein [Pseudonocardia sp. GCM10023141]|uniref:CaiB/BaiF CoA transferase family protein n=1 Tax=Pseudonocardia sp. GCM10023141 TaxID=3252653 RepID=UPI0036063BB9